jgi:hypothetical protein
VTTSSLPVQAATAQRGDTGDRPPRPAPRARLIAAGLILPAATLAVAGAGLAAPAAVTALQGTGYAVAVVWALSALLTARARERTPQWQVSCGALAAAVALSATRTAAGAAQSSHDLLFAAATLASALVIAL